jgi:hypothetical protein
MKTKHPILVALLKGLVPPIGIALTLWLTPTITTRTADAGTFVSAKPWAGDNIWGDSITTVYTTRGAIAVEGIFSALRGEPLVIRDTNREGMVICAVQPPATCAELSGSFVGAFTPVPGALNWLPHWMWGWLELIAWTWGAFGAVYFLCVWMNVDDDCGEAGTRGGDDGAKERAA